MTNSNPESATIPVLSAVSAQNSSTAMQNTEKDNTVNPDKRFLYSHSDLPLLDDSYD